MVKLSEICKINMGQSPDSTTYNTKGIGLPFFQGNADFGEIHPNTRMWCSEPVKVAHANDILISVRAPIGAMNIADLDCCIGRGLASITPQNDANLKYIWYAIYANKENIIKKGTGSTFKAIGKDVLHNLEIPLPPIDEQKEIAKKLDIVTGAIEKRKQQIVELDNLIKSKFLEMFGDPINNSRGWYIGQLNDVVDVRDGTHDSPQYYDSGYPFVTSKNIVDDRIDFTSCQYICEKDYNHFNERSRVDNGDIIMPMIGTIGGAIIVNKDRDFAIKNVSLIKFKNDDINRVFLVKLLNSDAVNEYFEKSKKGGTQQFISLGLIRNIPIILPPIELQNLFADFVTAINKTKEKMEVNIDELMNVYNGLMQKYFNK